MYSFAGMAEYAVVPNTAVFPLPDHARRGPVRRVVRARLRLLHGLRGTAQRGWPRRRGGPAGASMAACVIGCGGVGGSVLSCSSMRACRQSSPSM